MKQYIRGEGQKTEEKGETENKEREERERGRKREINIYQTPNKNATTPTRSTTGQDEQTKVDTHPPS